MASGSESRVVSRWFKAPVEPVEKKPPVKAASEVAPPPKKAKAKAKTKAPAKARAKAKAIPVVEAPPVRRALPGLQPLPAPAGKKPRPVPVELTRPVTVPAPGLPPLQLPIPRAPARSLLELSWRPPEEWEQRVDAYLVGRQQTTPHHVWAEALGQDPIAMPYRVGAWLRAYLSEVGWAYTGRRLNTARNTGPKVWVRRESAK